MAQVNGIDVDELRAYVASAERDVEVADRDPVVPRVGQAAIGPRWRSRPARLRYSSVAQAARAR